MSHGEGGRRRLVSLKVLYTLHGVASQRFVVKPADQVEARVFESSDLGVVALHSCLDAIRHSSPDYAEICDSSANDYAIYSVDYAEEGLPLQGHGRVSDHVLREVTGILRPSTFSHEQLELQIHLLPIRIPQDLPFDAPPENRDIDIHQVRDFLSSQMPHNMTQIDNSDVLQNKEAAAGAQPRHQSPGSNDMFQYGPSPGMQFGMPFPPMPALTPMPPMPAMPLMPASLPGSLQAGTMQTSASDTFLPSSPPVRAKPQRVSGSAGTVAPNRVNPMPDITPAKRSPPDSATTSGSKKKKQASPSSSCIEASCGNCGVATASTWRRAHLETGDMLLCNACGLYYKTKNAMRPSFLWDRSSRLASRVPEPQMAKPPPTKSIKRPSQLGSDPLGPPLSSGDAAPQQDSSAPVDSDAPVDLPRDPTTDVSSPEAGPSGPARQPLQQPLQPPPAATATAESAKAPSNTQSTRANSVSAQLEEIDEPQHPLQVHLSDPPSTPRRGTVAHNEDGSQQMPSSIEKLFFVTPDGKKTINIHLPGSGSAGKWLNRMLNPAEESSYFESFLASPTPKKNETNFRLSDSPICSSPPTSSNLFSEIPDWNVFPTSPTPLKALPPGTSHERPDAKAGSSHQPHKNGAAEVI